MQTRLQELTDKLFQEGLSKGKEEGELILADARAKSEEIISKAREEAAAIVAQAEKEAADLKSKVEADLKMAAGQTLQATRKDVEDLIVGKIAGEKVSGILKDPSFLKEIISAVAGKFSAEQSSDLSLVLPQSLKDQMEPFVESELGKLLGTNVTASFSKKIAGGFTIGPKDGGYFISLTDETFKDLICEYLRPVTKKFLFG